MKSNNTKGIRNNNPLNIRFNQRNNWQGQVGSDQHGFCIFKSMMYGYRAVWVTLKNYRERFIQEGKRFSIKNIIHRWAPPSENHTDAYTTYVSMQAEVDPDQDLRLYENHAELVRIVIAMAKFENSSNFTPNVREIEDGWALS